MREGKIVGSVAIDGEDLGQQQAHLRWFILDDSCRGTGIGRRLLSEAMAFCDSRQFSAVQLWTFKGLDAARKLYESFGFTLTREWQGDQWGKMMTEQQFTRPKRRLRAFLGGEREDYASWLSSRAISSRHWVCSEGF